MPSTACPAICKAIKPFSEVDVRTFLCLFLLTLIVSWSRFQVQAACTSESPSHPAVAGKLYDLCNMGGTGFNNLDEGHTDGTASSCVPLPQASEKPLVVAVCLFCFPPPRRGHNKFMRIAGVRDELLAILNGKAGVCEYVFPSEQSQLAS